MANIRKFSLGLVIATLVLMAAGGQAALGPNGSDSIQSQALAPTDRHRAVSRLVTTFIERNHYSTPHVDDSLSSLVLDRYIEALDGNKMFFYKKDIEDFDQYRYELDDAVRRGQIEPVFEIFRVYKQRNEERLAYSLDLLSDEPDFSLDEWYVFDRSDLDWVKSEDEMNELWRERVKNDALRLALTGKSWEESREILETRYKRAQKSIKQIESDDVFESFMNAYAQTLDPHSSYLLPRSSEEYRIQMSLSYEGIGASLQTDDDYVVVLDIIPGGPAALDGSILPNDRITGVGQDEDGKIVDVIGWRLDDVVQLIRGPGGSKVRLQILPAGAAPGSQEKIVPLTRDKIKLEAQAAQKDIVTIPREGSDLRIGVITIPSFYQDFNARISGDKDYTSTTRDVRRLVAELKKENIDGLVIDLRNNGGGHLSEAQELSGLFIENGPVVQIRQTNGHIEVLDDPDAGEVYDGPLAVLVNRYSASASEIFAAAIQDYKRGVIVGQQTFGKGSVQNLYSLDRYARSSDPGYGQLTLTIGKFYRVNGGSTQHRGVHPDIEMPSTVDASIVGESTRESALPWDSIASTNFAPRNQLDQSIELISQSHEMRAQSDPDFNFLVGDIEAFESVRDQKRVSLNIKVREAEQEAQLQARLERENQRRAGHGLAPLDSTEKLDEEELQDYLLEEAAQIVADMVKIDDLKTANLQKPAKSHN